MERVRPAEAFPPGEYLREELEYRGWTQADLAKILGVSHRLVNEIVTAKRAVTPETAKGLAAAFGTSAELWMNLESTYQLWRARSRSDSDAIAHRVRLYQKAPINEMIRRNWIKNSDSLEELEQYVLAFLEIPSIDEEPRAWSRAAARKSTPYDAETSAQTAWLFRARHLAPAVQASRFSEAALSRALEVLRTFRQNREDIRHIPTVLADAGVRLVIIEPLRVKGNRIDGACLWLDDQSPVVALSLRYDRIDSFWFTLMHELGHVQARHGLEGYAPIDVDLLRDGVVRDGDTPPQEKEADTFAEGFLVPQDRLNDFIRRVRPLYSTTKITGFAAVQKVHPGLVVGQLRHRGEIGYTHHHKLIQKVREIVVQSTLTDGWGFVPPAGL